MASGIVYEGVTRQPDDNDHGDDQHMSTGILSGLKLWFSHGVPQRSWFIEQAKTNGAEITPLEKQADVRLVDHTRKNNAPGTHSYRFVELSIRNGLREDLDKHRVGVPSSVDRPVGSIVTGPKGTRTKFTDEEDQYLWNVVTPLKEKGGHWKGNAIYQQIAGARPTHTFQSWRDRYLKHVIYQTRTITSNVSLEADVADREEVTNAAVEVVRNNGVPCTSTTQATSKKRPRTEEDPNQELAEELTTQQQGQSRFARRVSPGKRARLLDGIEASAEAAEAELQYQPEALPRTSPRKRNANTAIDGMVDPRHPRIDERSPSVKSAHSEPPDKGPLPDEYPEKYPRNFTRAIYRMLFRATPAIEKTDEETLAEGFDEVAENHPEIGHPGQDWRVFWQEMVWPRYQKQFDKGPLPPSARIPAVWSMRQPPHSQSKLIHSKKQEATERSRSSEAEQQCTQCMTTESTKWRHDNQGNTYCNDCGKFMKDARLRSISGAFTEVPDEPSEAEEEQNDASKPVEAGQKQLPLLPATPQHTAAKPSTTLVSARPFAGYSDAGVQTSPILSPQPVSGRGVGDDALPHRGGSRPPEPNEARKRRVGRGSQSHSQESDRLHAEVASGYESVEIAPQVSRTSRTPDRRKKASSAKTLEIPSTPEHVLSPDPDAGTDDRSVAVQPQASNRSDSPLFISEDERGGKASASPTNRNGSSPFRVRLFNSSPRKDLSSQRGIREQSPQSEADYDFGTGPDLSQEWDTAPESPSGYKGQLGKPSPASSAEADYTLGLPEPEGGWSDLGIPEPAPNEFQEDPPEIENETEYDGTQAAAGSNTDGSYEVIDLTLEEDDVEPSESASQRGSRLNEIRRPTTHGKMGASPLPQRTRTAPVAGPTAAANNPADTEIEAWWNQQLQRFESSDVRLYVLNRVISAAVDATSFKFELASSIISDMIAKGRTHRGRELRNQNRWGGLVPGNVKGVWTENDDMALNDELGLDEARRIMRKHGVRGCEDRRTFLRLQKSV